MKFTLLLTVTAFVSFVIARIQLQPEIKIVEKHIGPETSLIMLKSIVADELEVKISGPARILWAGENQIANDGVYRIPLSQIPNENDLRLKNFPFTGNTNTQKFYPSNSHFARCVKPTNRRYFQTKEEALAQGFIPSKSIK